MSRSPAPLLRLERLTHEFGARPAGLPGRRGPRVRALDDVSLDLHEGEALGLVGESGSGKTTLARCAVRLLRPDAGAIRLRGVDVSRARGRALRPLRREVQMVFQDPASSLNPRRRVGEVLGVAARRAGTTRSEARRSGRGLLEQVGLAEEHLDRYPHELSGGECQRVAIARALAPEPRALVLDEPVSALDVSVRAQVVNLLADLREVRGLSYLFVSHDLGLVRVLCDRVAVMHRGRVVEQGAAWEVCERPRHPYTRALLSAVPLPEPRARTARRRRGAGELSGRR